MKSLATIGQLQINKRSVALASLSYKIGRYRDCTNGWKYCSRKDDELFIRNSVVQRGKRSLDGKRRDCSWKITIPQLNQRQLEKRTDRSIPVTTILWHDGRRSLADEWPFRNERPKSRASTQGTLVVTDHQRARGLHEGQEHDGGTFDQSQPDQVGCCACPLPRSGTSPDCSRASAATT